MSDISNYQAAEGLSDEGMAELLSDKLGRAISTRGYQIVKGRRDAPPEWLDALSISPHEPSISPGDAPDARDDVHKPIEVLPFQPASAKTQLTLVYTLAGKGASMAMNAPEVERVWAAHAPKIADAYIEWGKQNKTVAHYLTMLTLGGPLGDLVMLHGSMIVTTLIVAKRIQVPGAVPPSMRTPEETDLIDDGNGNSNKQPEPARETD